MSLSHVAVDSYGVSAGPLLVLSIRQCSMLLLQNLEAMIGLTEVEERLGKFDEALAYYDRIFKVWKSR